MTQTVDVPGLGPVDFPDGMPHADMEKAIKRSMTAKAGSMAIEGTGPMERGLIGAGKAVSDLWQGAQQLVGKANTNDVQETRDRDAALMKTTAGQVGNFAGNVGMAVPTMFVPGVNSYTGAALLGGAQGLLQPTTEGESRGTNTLLGAAGGVAGQGAGNLVGRAIRPVQSELTGEEARLAAEAARRNIPLSTGQATGSRPVQVAESVMENLPFTSGPQLAQRQAQQTAFNRAVGSTFGSAEDAITPQVAGQARNRIGQTFTDLSSRNTLQANQGLVQDLGNIQGQVNRYATPDVARVVNNNIDDILSKVEPGDIIAGRAYRELDSQIGRLTRSTSNGDIKHYLGQVRDTLRTAMDQSISATDRSAWREARQQYANLMTVSPLAAKSETGDISGKTLLNAANQSSKNAKFGGPSELAELGRIGRAFVADQIPNSGTAQRQLIQSLLTGGGGAGLGAAGAAATGNDPIKGAGIGLGVTGMGLLAPRAIQMLMNSEAGRAYLTNGLLRLTPQELAGINALARPAGTAGLLGYTQ